MSTTQATDRTKRTTVAISAYHASPHAGSENTKAWQWIRAAARSHDVVVFTQARCARAIEEELQVRPIDGAREIMLVPVECGSLAQHIRRIPFGNYVYYGLWQRLARQHLIELSSRRQIDLLHHVSFGADWLPTAMTGLGLPFIWGPVGGATRTPTRLLRYLGIRGAISAIVRDSFTGIMRGTVGRRTARGASLILAFNRDTADAFKTVGTRITIRNSVAVEPSEIPPRERQQGRLIFAGRLLPWKGVSLAITALEHLDPTFSLTIFGDGPDERRLRKLAERHRVSDRVHFVGRIPRAELLREYGRAHALVFPSMHDSGGWAVAEAVEAGCPVVCLDLGGPPDIVQDNGAVVSHRATDLGRAMAEAIVTVPDTVKRGHWANTRLPSEIQRWYAEVLELHRTTGR